MFDLNQIQLSEFNLGRDAPSSGTRIIAALIMENERKHAGGGDAGDRRQEGGGNSNTEEEQQRRSKQHAKYGQWQTPPLPAFAASGIVPPPSSTTAATTANTTTTTGINLPTNADEYARMLQEAYKKGAEAGARAQQATEQINLLGGTAATSSTTTTEPSIGLPLSPVGQYVNVNNNPPSMATAQIEPLIPNVPMSNIINYKTSFFPTPVPSSSMGEGGEGEFLINNTTAETPSSFAQSKSMPDMSSYSSQVNDEEDKRKKRLARNRASARLRRLKKKNLVDSYEGEVGILESALSKLRSHQWGSDIIDHEVLIEALSMERGQQPLTPEGRRELIQSILNQQREQVANLLECQMESWLLCSLATSDNHDDDDDDEMVKLTSELKSLLSLSPEQISQIEQCSQGCLHEVQDLFTIDDCLQSIHTNQWLLDEGVDEVASQMTSMLNQTQLSKFLSWSDHNAEAIEKLDYINVLGGEEKNAPLFEFGVDEGIADGD